MFDLRYGDSVAYIFLIGTFIVLLVPSVAMGIEFRPLGFGTLQVFFSAGFLVGLSLISLITVGRSWTSFRLVEKVVWSSAFFLFVSVLAQLIFRFSSLGLGYATGVLSMVLALALLQNLRLSGPVIFNHLVVAGGFLIVGSTFLHLAFSAESHDVRVTYALAILSPALMWIGWGRQLIFTPEYFLTWGIYILAAWQELRAPAFSVAIVLIVWSLGKPANWKARILSVLVSTAAVFGLWIALVSRPILFQSLKPYLSGRDLRLEAATQTDVKNFELLFGTGPGSARRRLLEAGFSDGDLHSTVMTMAIDYGLGTLVMTAVFFVGVLLKISRLEVDSHDVVHFGRWVPVIMVAGMFVALGFVYSTVAIFETLAMFIASLVILSFQQSGSDKKYLDVWNARVG